MVKDMSVTVRDMSVTVRDMSVMVRVPQGHERHGQGHELRYLCDTIDPVGAIEAIEGKLLMLQRRPSQQGYRDSNSFLPPFLPPSLRCSLLPSLPSETVGLTEMALLHGVDDSATG